MVKNSEALLPEISARFVPPYLDYILEKHGSEAMASFLGRWGVTTREVRDPRNWVGLRFIEGLLKEVSRLGGSVAAVEQSSRASVSARYLGTLHALLRAIGRPSLFYGQIFRLGPLWNRAGSWKVIKAERERLRVAYQPNKPKFVERTTLVCVARKAQLAAVPTMWDLPPAIVRESECQCNGSDRCVYDVRWVERRFPVAAVVGCILGAAAGLLLARAGLVATPAWVLPASLGAVGLLLGAMRDAAVRMRMHQRFAGEQGEALETSLKDLTARFEELQESKRDVDQKVVERTHELAERGRELEQALAKQAELGRLKTEFFQNVSHELRTPLALIVTPLQILLDARRLDGPAGDDVRTALQSAESLERFIDRLLEQQKFETGSGQLRRAPADLSALREPRQVDGAALPNPKSPQGFSDPLVSTAPELPNPPPADAPRLLLVEDEPAMRAFLARSLGSRFRITEAADGEEALTRLSEGSFDVMLADVMLPTLNGLALCARVRADPTTRALPVVLVSARRDVESIVSAFAQGADAYLVKPFDLRELLARIDARLRPVRPWSR